jgi:anaerobic magnesium-protoporphyrin IX monomethyl ester cyclase
MVSFVREHQSVSVPAYCHMTPLLVSRLPEQSSDSRVDETNKHMQRSSPKLTLAFVPGAHPAYVPLGVAVLAGHVRRHSPNAELHVVDLNQHAWRSLLASTTASRDAAAFFAGRAGNFYDEATYLAQLTVLGDLARQLGEVERDARRYLEGEPPSAPLAALLIAEATAVLEGAPDVIGLSALYLPQLTFALALARWLDAEQPPRPDRRPLVLLGGAATSHVEVPELLAACPFLDGVAVGEGEAVLSGLLEGRSHFEIPGLATPQFPHTAPDCAAAALLLGAADFSDLALGGYLVPEPVLPVLLSRGCRWRACAFCAHNFSFGDYRQKDAGAFADELATYGQRYGARNFYLADQYVGPQALAALSDAIRARGLDLAFHSMARPTGRYTKELLATARAAGCVWLSFGVETGSERLLDLCRKGTHVPEIRAAITESARADISNLVMLVFGLPTSTDEDVEATLDLLGEIHEHVDAFTESSFVLFDHTEFARRAPELGLTVSGRRPLLTVLGRTVHSFRLDFTERGVTGDVRPPRSGLEIARFQSRRRWLGEARVYEQLVAEHYLLYAAHCHR